MLSYAGDISDENEKIRRKEEQRNATREKQSEADMNQIIDTIQTSLYVRQHPDLFISPEDAVEDYNYMWQVLEDNYPFLGIAERASGRDYRAIKEKYLREIEKPENQFDAESLSVDMFAYSIIGPCLNEFGRIGDLLFVYKNWNYYLNYSYYGNYTYFSDIIMIGDNVMCRLLDENTAYLELKGQQGNKDQFEYDRKKIMDFYSEIQGCENLIINISNYSGDDTYWKKFIVEPNITEDVDVDYYFFVKNGKENIDYFNSIDMDSWSSEVDIDLDLMPNINKNDLQMFDKLYKRTETINSANGKKLFSGNIYMLIDRITFSYNAENFVYFCQSTGFAETVGYKTSANRSIIYGNNAVKLPNSGLIFEYSPFCMMNTDGSCIAEYGILPDHICKGTEKPLEVCRKIIQEKDKKDK